MKLHCWISSLGLVLSLTYCPCSTLTINGFEGQDVTLPCRYDSSYHGLCDACWMRGSIPSTGCGNQIVYASEKKVVFRSSERYQINGAIEMGDASLTILNARKTDTGLYGCRVHVPGWFNDKKIEVFLDITEAAQQTTTTLEYTTTTTTTDIPTHGPVSTTQQTATISDSVIEQTGPALTTQEKDRTSSLPENITMTTYNITHGPVLTTLNDVTSISEHSRTNNTETLQTSSTLGNGTTTPDTITHGPAIPTISETTTTPTDVTTKELENPPSEGEKLVNEDTLVLTSILVPILLLIVLGISAFFLISKYKGKFMAAVAIPNCSSSYVSYCNLDNSVTLPMTDPPNNKI